MARYSRGQGVGIWIGLLLLGLLATIGCQGQTSSSPAPSSGTGTSEPAPVGGSSTTPAIPASGPGSSATSATTPTPETGATGNESTKITLEAVDKAGLQKVLESHKGKVVFVDFWATWCAPCKKMFPHTVELHHKFADQGLVVISMAMDEEGDEAAVLEFLQGQKAQFTHFRSKQGAEPEAFDAFDLDNGALPHFKLYGRDGQLARKFVSGDIDAGPIVPAEVEKAIEQALAAQP